MSRVTLVYFIIDRTMQSCKLIIPHFFQSPLSTVSEKFGLVSTMSRRAFTTIYFSCLLMCKTATFWLKVLEIVYHSPYYPVNQIHLFQFYTEIVGGGEYISSPKYSILLFEPWVMIEISLSLNIGTINASLTSDLCVAMAYYFWLRKQLI